MRSRQSRFIHRIFAEVPVTYERVNHLLTLGLDTLWRRRAARVAAATGGNRWADICSGTGEMTALLARRAGKETTICALDFSRPMLREARRKTEATDIAFIVADVDDLPFAGESLDLITMSFATRNINTGRAVLAARLAGFYRILKPGGSFVNLETSQPPWRLVRWLRNLYVRVFVEAIGGKISGSRLAYAYLAETIPRFYTARELAEIMREAGFQEVTYTRYLLGAAAIHRCVKR